MSKHLTAGTIIHGTLRNADVIPALLDALRTVDAESADRLTTRWEAMEPESEDAGWLAEELYALLDTFAPAGHYVGSHPGDGADIGVWPSEDYRPPVDVRAEVVKLATRGLRGTFIAPTSRKLPTWGERYRPEPGDCIRYDAWDDVEPSDAVAFLVDDATGSDYTGSDYTVANLRWLRENAGKYGFEVSGGHGTYGWALLLDLPDADPDWLADLLEVLEGLIDYPIIDEQMWSEVGMEWEDEAWTSWAASDFERALRRRFPGDAADEAIANLTDAELRALFEQYREASNTDWVPENSGSHIDIDRIVNAIPADAFPADA